MPGDRALVERAVVDLGRGLDQLARDRQAGYVLRLVGVSESLRDRVPSLEQKTVLDDQVVSLDLYDATGLPVVACDDFVAFHGGPGTHFTATLIGNATAMILVTDWKPAIARVAAVSETTPEAEPRKLAEEARDRVRFEEEALGLADQVYRVARRLVSTREEAEDLMQETYARAFRSWRSYQPGTNLRAWLLRILTNLNIDRGRRVQRSPDMQPLEEGDYFLYNKLEEAGDTDEERVDRRLSQDDAVAALSEVPHDFRDVIVLVDIGDFSYADAAQILDIPIGTVMSRLHRGRRILKKELAERAVGSTV